MNRSLNNSDNYIEEFDFDNSSEKIKNIKRRVKKSLLLIALIFIVYFFIQSFIQWKDSNPKFLKLNTSNLTSEREAYKTKLIVKMQAPQDYEEELPPSNVKEVEYMSGDLTLKAWLLNDPGDGKKHPALVYAHGGFSFSAQDWEFTLPYINSGYIVMTPIFRGENGNPGNFEFFYGEVNDLIAAGKFLSSISYVDSENIFLSGHSTGGTLAMLTSMMKSPYKAVATFGAIADQKYFFQSRWGQLAPFNKNNLKEVCLRSPLEFVESVQIPLFIYVGKHDIGYLHYSENFIKKSKELGKPCELNVLEGDHFSSLTPAIEKSIDKFNKLIKSE